MSASIPVKSKVDSLKSIPQKPSTLVPRPSTQPLTPSASPAGAQTTGQQTALAVVGAGKFQPGAGGQISEVSTDQAMGQQLTAQYHRATGGMTEVLRFGGLMMQLREHIDSTRGVDPQKGRSGVKYDAGSGVKAWLSEHAPEVKESTAYRFLHVAEAVMEDFRGQLPTQCSFVNLVTSSSESLSEPLRAKQSELWDFVNGTSQRSWLDRFAPPKPRGGHHPSQKAPLSESDKIQLALINAQGHFQQLVVDLEAFCISKRHEGFDLLGDADRALLLGLLVDVNSAVKKSK